MLLLFLFMLFPLILFLRTTPYVSLLLTKSAWAAILIAVVISSAGGTILERFVTTFPGEAVLSPIMNGLGGNLAAVQASRVSTAFHTTGRGPQDRRSTLVLFFLTVPIAIIFLLIISLIQAGHTTLTPLFLLGYSLASLVQVGLLLPLANFLVRFIWDFGLDPDNIAIPFVTAFGDLFGTAALTICFAVLWQLGDQDTDVGD